MNKNILDKELIAKIGSLREQNFSIVEIGKMLGLDRNKVYRTTVKYNMASLSKKDKPSKLKGRVIGKYLLSRVDAQNAGRQLAKLNEPLHIKGCMMYWGEGSKTKNSVQFTNCDYAMHIIFVKFIRSYFSDAKMTFAVNYFRSGEKSYSDIIDFWCEKLCIQREDFRSPTEREKYYPLPKGKVKFPFGILTISIHRTDILHSIYGAIQEYAGINIESMRP